MNGATRKLLLVSVMQLLACEGEGLGRAIVGELPPPPTGDGCWSQPECISIAAAFVPLREGVVGPAIGANCAALDANVVESSPLNLRCARWDLTLVPEAPRALSALTTQFTELHLFAERPARLTLIGATLAETQIVMHGPVALRIEQASLLNNVQVLDDGGGQASFELVESEARGLVLGDATRDFSGAAIATRATVSAGKLLSRSLRIENTLLNDASAVAQDLVMQNIRGRKVRVEVERGAIGGSAVEDFWVQRCGDLQLTSCTLQKVMIVPCTTELHISRSDVLKGSIAGRIASKETSYRGISFGAGVATELELLDGSLYDSVLCDNLQRLALSAASQCNLCPTLTATLPAIACRVIKPTGLGDDGEQAEVFSRNPECPALDQALPCDPVPKDDYPF